MYQIYGLDPLYCISTPGFTNRAMLKMTSVEIKLMTDLNMRLMIENGIRGGNVNLSIIMQIQIINMSTLILIMKKNHT